MNRPLQRSIHDPCRRLTRPKSRMRLLQHGLQSRLLHFLHSAERGLCGRGSIQPSLRTSMNQAYWFRLSILLENEGGIAFAAPFSVFRPLLVAGLFGDCILRPLPKLLEAVFRIVPALVGSRASGHLDHQLPAVWAGETAGGDVARLLELLGLAGLQRVFKSVTSLLQGVSSSFASRAGDGTKPPVSGSLPRRSTTSVRPTGAREDRAVWPARGAANVSQGADRLSAPWSYRYG